MLEARRQRPAVPLSERAVEGEVLINRRKRARIPSDEASQRERFIAGSVLSQDETIGVHATQRAINAYLVHAAMPNPDVSDQPRTVDYYV